MINGAGHHVYLDKPDMFNKYVQEACAKADEYDPQLDTNQQKNEDSDKIVDIQSRNSSGGNDQAQPSAVRLNEHDNS